MSGEQVLDDRYVNGRREHFCTYCGRTIVLGERHRTVKAVGDYGFVTWRECAHCEALFSVIYAHDPDLRYDEDWDLGEYVTENAPGSDLADAWRRRWADIDVDRLREHARKVFPPHQRVSS